jgi:hypothetical protein
VKMGHGRNHYPGRHHEILPLYPQQRTRVSGYSSNGALRRKQTDPNDRHPKVTMRCSTIAARDGRPSAAYASIIARQIPILGGQVRQ